MSEAIFAKEPSKFVYEAEKVTVEFLPPDRYLGTRGPDCVVFRDYDGESIHIDDADLAAFYRAKVNE